MKMIDSHIHADIREDNDFIAMQNNEITDAITCAYYPKSVNNESILLEYLQKLSNYKNNYINIHKAIGIHPRNIVKNPEKIYKQLTQWINNNEIIAIGEIGLEKSTEEEIAIFKKQLEIAENTKTKVIVHTPRKNKEETLNKILNIIPTICNPKLVVIDHMKKELIPKIIDDDYTIGLTIQKEKLTTDEAIAILDTYGFDKFILNSDISTEISNPIAVPQTINKLKKQGYEKKKIEKIKYKNAEKFFNLS